jgi:uncharacterized protein
VKQFRLETGDGRTVCERCVRAESPLRRMRGLLGRRSLPADEGILLRPAGSVHTAFMRFPIDVVFVDGDGHVLRVAEAVPPWRTAGARGANAVVELAAGAAAAAGLRAGQTLALPS